jgi:hypothetical protein
VSAAQPRESSADRWRTFTGARLAKSAGKASRRASTARQALAASSDVISCQKSNQ